MSSAVEALHKGTTPPSHPGPKQNENLWGLQGEVKQQAKDCGSQAKGKADPKAQAKIGPIQSDPLEIAANKKDKAKLKAQVEPPGTAVHWGLNPNLGAMLEPKGPAAVLTAGDQGGEIGVRVETADKKALSEAKVTQVKYEPVAFGAKELLSDGKTTVQAKVATVPAGRTPLWGFKGDAHGASVDGKGVITPPAEFKGPDPAVPLDLWVKATDAKVPTAEGEGKIPLVDAKYAKAKEDFKKFTASTYRLAELHRGP